MIAIVTDSTSDLTREQLAGLSVRSVPLYVLFDGKNLKDGFEITPTELFRGMKAGIKPPSTSQPSPAEFAEAYRTALEGGADEVLSIHISGKLSGTVQSARLAAQDFGGRVTVVDSQTASGGLGMQVQRAARRVAEGRSVSEIVAELERVQTKMAIRFMVGTLDFLRINGRIGGAQAMLGSLLNIKPILKVENGRVEAAGKVRGSKRAVAEIVEFCRDYVQQHGPSNATFLLTEGAEELLTELRAGLNSLDLEQLSVLPLGAVVATHVGPGTAGVCLEPKEV
ncbi:DegV family protein with EDD domain [Deinobacterium chartae]|uniref:DegV family protein with EDD domain n=2 Tax=Deinobacterium chartae TaxID=521158 RepID=A0A841I025_9DEIO|nr:DegV family protein with EDD domain [Deinobacterium chartae]